METSLQFDHSLLSLLTSKEGFNFLSSLWLSEATFQEAFQGLCSILTRGKDLCSPTKRHKRKANERFFSSLSGLNCDSPRTKQRLVDGAHATKVLRLAQGLSGQSDRWTKMSADDILSVTLLMDTSIRGSVTWQEFYSYCNRVDSALTCQSAKNTPQKAIADLYTVMVHDRQADCTKSFMELVGAGLDEKTLGRFTAQLIKLAICARLNAMNPLTLLLNLKVYEQSVASKKAESTVKGTRDKVISEANAAEIPLDALASLFLHLGADVIGEGSAGVQRAKLNFQKRMARSQTVKDNSENLVNISSISSAAEIDNTSTSFLLDTPARDLALDTSIAVLRENASAISARLAVQSQHVDSAVNIWGALQTLESELTKAAAPCSPRTPATPRTRGVIVSPSSSSDGRPSPLNLFATPASAASSPRSLSSGVVVDDLAIELASEMQASVVLSSGKLRSSSNSIVLGSKARASPIANLSTVRTDLGIFKSPAARSRISTNPNVYSEETMSWESDKSKLTNVYNERFQSTNQCIDARKIFKVLGLGECADAAPSAAQGV